MRISIYGSKEIQAIVLALKSFDRDLASQLRKQSRTVIEPVWKEAVRDNARTDLEIRVLSDTARVSVTNQNVTLKSAGIGRSLSGSAKPSDLAHAAEFGADRQHVKGKRHTQRQFKPRNLKGYVVYPAAADTIPRIAALWVQTTVRTLFDKMEGKR